jgi:hypothetical protein
VNSGGVHAREEKDGGEALTVCQQGHGGAFKVEDDKVERRVEGIEEVDSRRGRTLRTELRAAMAMVVLASLARWGESKGEGERESATERGG